MKIIILFLSFMLFMTGCTDNNNASNLTMPKTDYTDFDYTIYSDNFSLAGEYWISLNHSIFFEKANINIRFLNILTESSGNTKVTFIITNDGGKSGSDFVEFNTSIPSFKYKFVHLPATSMQLLEILVDSDRTMALIKLDQLFIL